MWPALEFRNKTEAEAVCDALGALLSARATDLYLMAARITDLPATVSA